MIGLPKLLRRQASVEPHGLGRVAHALEGERLSDQRLCTAYSNSLPLGSGVASPCRACALSSASRLSAYQSENGMTRGTTCVQASLVRRRFKRCTQALLGAPLLALCRSALGIDWPPLCH